MRKSVVENDPISGNREQLRSKPSVTISVSIKF
ncbi:hypothetical protein SAMN04489716_7066 [Actinoplanes derwentensis]|uniref:Uncharacterized protein n=1 Tax=Actinoplanes derwentensis TaxID=113562 RepID=A0A1H2CXC2_9ACTN|nr:hypothetical protein SAMN04489716_7066 [Actinoplanes derwentensis]